MIRNFRIVKVDYNYCDYLREFDHRVSYNSGIKELRPFIGILFVVDKFEYFAPLSSPKVKHLSMKNNIDLVKIDGGRYGVVNFNNMIPVDDSLIRILDVKPGKKDTKTEKAYKILCAKELDWIQKNQDAIVKKANKLYQMITADTANHGLKKRCLDFKKLESVLEKRLNHT